MVAFTSELRDTDDPFDVIACGITYGMAQDAARSTLQSYEEAGATWWFEWLDCGRPGTFKEVREHVQAGPPEC